MKRMLLLGLGLVTFAVGACSDDGDTNDTATSTSSGSAQGGATSVGGSGGTTSATGGSGGAGGGNGGGAGEGGAGGGACEPPAGMFDNMGCLTFAGGNAICGSDSDDVICNAAIGCGESTGDLGQCHIDCSQGMQAGECYTQADIDCVYEAAVCDASCPDLAACHWPFF